MNIILINIYVICINNYFSLNCFHFITTESGVLLLIKLTTMKNQLTILVKLILIVTVLVCMLPISADAQNQEDSKTVFIGIFINDASKDKKVEFGVTEIHRVARERNRSFWTKKVFKRELRAP